VREKEREWIYSTGKTGGSEGVARAQHSGFLPDFTLLQHLHRALLVIQLCILQDVCAEIR
jgi:hypothetical protein